MLTRRRALTLGAGALAAGFGAGALAAGFGAAGAAFPGPNGAAPPGAAPPPGRQPADPTTESPAEPPVATGVETRYSAARGRDVQLAVMLPTGVPARDLPVCLALHGRGGNAAGMVGLGLPGFLAAALDAGRAPFALVAVDGGDSWWIGQRPGDDPQAMLREELPTWLPPFGLAAVPSAVFGISMGGFGALVYARGRAADPPAVGVLSPAVFRSWADARARDAFADEATWAAAEPLRNPGGLPHLGIWCGEQDPLIGAARELAASRPSALARFGPGGHDPDYWRAVLPEVLNFLWSPPV